jgi:hypothetical protein
MTYGTLKEGAWLTQTVDNARGHGISLVMDGAGDPHLMSLVPGTDALMYARGQGDIEPVPRTDLTIAGVEVVQAIQDRDNSVPLVAGKPTVVRIYPDTWVGTVPGVTAKVTGQRGAQVLPDPEPIVGSVTAGPVVYWDLLRGRREGGLLYRLPPEWLSGAVTLTVELNPSHAPVESNFDNN